MKKLLLILPLVLCGCDSDAKPVNIDKSLTYHLGVLDCGFNNQGCTRLEGFLNCEKSLRKSLANLTQKQLDTLDKEMHSKLGLDKTAYSQAEEGVKKLGMSYANCF